MPRQLRPGSTVQLPPAPCRPGAPHDVAEVCIHQLFEAQAVRRPGAAALALGDESLSYGELNRSANRLARALRARGVGPDMPVAIYTRRSFTTLIGILGVLKAGGAYLALDPTYPDDRLAFMVRDSGAALVITDSSPVPPLEGSALPVVPIDQLTAERGEEDDSNPGYDASPARRAYVIYTSGSTGMPKGVVVTHENLVHSTLARFSYYAEPLSSFLLLSSFAFDSSVAGIFWTLCGGGTLVIADEALQHDPPRLGEVIERRQVSHLLAVPSLYDLILSELNARRHACLRVVVVAGEPCPPRLVQRHLATLPGAALYNEYGPTEATVWCSVFACREPIDAPSVPIGRAIAGTQLHVLDEGMHPVPEGNMGELYVGGKGVTPGYLERPELTAERFLPDPFGVDDAARLYRTGDRVRRLPDGNLEFLGRVDHQVKIRGFRVELGEIEAVLRSHREVADAVVSARETASGATRLVAHVRPRRAPWPSKNQLLVFLRQELPEHMVPSTVVLIDAFPQLPNGKVDRAALTVPASESPERSGIYVAARSELERSLAGIWAEVLAVDEVGIEDDFFDLGGDSLLAMQVVARARGVGILLESEQIDRFRTIARLTPHVEIGRAPAAARPEGVSGPAPLVPRQRLYLERDHVAGGWIEQTPLDLLQPIEPSMLEDALRAVVDRHDALRLRFTRRGGTWRQEIEPVETGELVTAVDAGGAKGDRWQAVVATALERGLARIDVTAGPLVQLAYARRLRKPSRLFLLVHHLAIDAYSIPILLEDLEIACRALLEGHAPAFPPSTSPFRDWARRLERWAGSDELRAELDYWQAQSLPPAITPDLPGQANDLGLLGYVVESLTPAETATVLHDLPRLQGVRVNEILLTALLLGARRLTGSRAFTVDLNAHGREPIFPEIDVSRTVGWFACQAPVGLDLEASPDQLDALRAVHEQLHRVPHGGLGYGVLRYMSDDEGVRGRLAELPPAVLKLNYLGRADFVASTSQLLSQRKKHSTQPPATPVRRSPRIDLSAHLQDGALHLRLRFHEGVYRRETIEHVGTELVEALRAMIQSCGQASGARPGGGN